MNSCLHCKYAEWKRTATGRRHPDGTGRCTYVVKVTLPLAFYWPSYMCNYHDRSMPHLSGGYLDRKKPYEKCPTFQPVKP